MLNTNQTLLIPMTEDQLRGMFIDCLHAFHKYQSTAKGNTHDVNGPNYVYGLSGLAKLLKCSHPTAQRIKDSGKIPFSQVGRKLIFDADAVLSALGKK